MQSVSSKHTCMVVWTVGGKKRTSTSQFKSVFKDKQRENDSKSFRPWRVWFSFYFKQLQNASHKKDQILWVHLIE